MSVKKEVFGIHPSGKEVYKFEIVNNKDKKGKGIQIIYGPQVTVIKSDFEEYVEKVSQ